MSLNASPPHHGLVHHCDHVPLSHLVSSAFVFTKSAATLPPCLLVLALGLQRRRRRPLEATAHADAFVYHAAAFELLFAAATGLYFSGYQSGSSAVLQTGVLLSAFVFPGEISLQVLTAAERYLAVVRPVAYRRLRGARGLRARNLGLACVWLSSSGWVGVAALYVPEIPFVPYVCALLAALALVSFCSGSVLRVLVQPGPGDPGGERERVDGAKRRAFVTITAILGVTLLFLLGVLAGLAVERSNLMSWEEGCAVLMGGLWCSLPSSLVLPAQFLLRAKEPLLLCRRKQAAN